LGILSPSINSGLSPELSRMDSVLTLSLDFARDPSRDPERDEGHFDFVSVSFESPERSEGRASPLAGPNVSTKSKF